MPVKVAVEKDHWYDKRQYADVPTKKEHNALKEKINSIDSLLSEYATETKLNGEIELLETKLNKVAKDVESRLEELLAALKNGLWKKRFSMDIEDALCTIEKRYSEINAELDVKMSRLAGTADIEEQMRKIFIEQEEKIKAVIRKSGELLKAELDEKMKGNDLMEILKKESQNVTWEN